ncbi:MAG: hypothetical protein KatS3mg002_0445 [Candidatus Woesearchaeota archaeon]|nr:MAG: hypothetical protein KatS3mg002_0445 [Candidatus Woesearchaeota archaeon]
MLTPARVLEYVKTQLGYPFVQIELDDEKIIQYLSTYTLRELSYYIPFVKRMYLDFKTAEKVEGRANEYYLEDDEGLEIMGVKDIYFNRGDFAFLGHPFFGPFSLSDINNWALSIESSMMIQTFSDFNFTFEFRSPNILRISSFIITSAGGCTVEYETIQPSDFSGIPNELQSDVLEFCLADVMILLGRIRKKYGDGQLRTPFGEIPLGSDVLDEGKEKKRDLKEKFERLSYPNVIIDHG